MLEEENINEPEKPQFIVGAVIGSASLTEAQIEHQIEMDEEEGWGNDDDEDELLGYECMGCGNVQDNESGFGCDKCMGHCLEPWYG